MKPKRLKYKRTLLISLIYLLFGSIWILITDQALNLMASNHVVYSTWQTYKGAFFVVLSTLLIYGLLQLEEHYRQEVEKKLIESEARYQSIVEDQNELICRFRSDGTMTFVNEAFCRYFQKPRREILRSNYFDLFPEEDRGAIRTHLLSAKPAHPTTPLHLHRLTRPDGSTRWIQWSDRAIFGEDGALIEYQSVGRDVTEMVQRERELASLASISDALRGVLTRSEAVRCFLEQLSLSFSLQASAFLSPSSEHTVFVELASGKWQSLSGQRVALPNGETILDCATLKKAFRVSHSAILNETAHLICWPLTVQDTLIGFLWLGSEHPLKPEEQRLLQTIGNIIASTIQRITLYEQTTQRLARLQTLHNIDQAVNSSLDLSMTLSIAAQEIGERLGIDAVDILLLDQTSLEFYQRAGYGFRSPAFSGKTLRLGEGFASRAALERRTIVVENLLDEIEKQGHTPPTALKLLKEAILQEGFCAYVAVPLIPRGQLCGVLELFQRSPLSSTPEWLSFLETLAGQVSIAIDNASLFNSLQRSNLDLVLAYDTTIEGWSRAMDLRDKETEGHTQRVTEMTLRLAKEMGVPNSELIHIRRGALLHDIGKLGVPDHILLKPGKLTAEEWEIMRQHPVYAHQMLSPIEYLHPALDIPYCHHERWDGSGYPRGLKGEEIPLAARIFAVVDVWDALRSERPYRPAWREEKVRAYIRSLSGIHFDPRVVEAFLKILNERPI